MALQCRTISMPHTHKRTHARTHTGSVGHRHWPAVAARSHIFIFNLTYFVVRFRFDRCEMQLVIFFHALFAAAVVTTNIVVVALLHSPSNGVHKLNKYIDTSRIQRTFCRVVFAHRFAFHNVFFIRLSSICSICCGTVSPYAARAKKKSNIFSWLKINWMNLSQLYGYRESERETKLGRERENEREHDRERITSFRCVRATVEKWKIVDIDINCTCQM